MRLTERFPSLDVEIVEEAVLVAYTDPDETAATLPVQVGVPLARDATRRAAEGFVAARISG